MIRAGRLRHVITYQSQTSSMDDYGGPTKTWEDVTPPIRADVQPVYVKEQVESMAAQAPYDIKVIHRFMAGITAGMRFLWDGRVYDIVGQPINVDMRDRELIILGRYNEAGA